MFGWFKEFMVAVGLGMLIVGVSTTDDTPLWITAAFAFPGLALMFIFGVVFEDERDY